MKKGILYGVGVGPGDPELLTVKARRILSQANTCAVMSGRMTIEEDDGNKCQYYFATSGKGFTGVQSGSLYYLGKLQTADNGMKYEVISIPGSNGKHTNYVVNASGKVMKNSSALKDSDGTKYSTNSSGILTKINGESVSDSSVFGEPREPDWNSY